MATQSTQNIWTKVRAFNEQDAIAASGRESVLKSYSTFIPYCHTRYLGLNQFPRMNLHSMRINCDISSLISEFQTSMSSIYGQHLFTSSFERGVHFILTRSYEGYHDLRHQTRRFLGTWRIPIRANTQLACFRHSFTGSGLGWGIGVTRTSCDDLCLISTQ